MLKILWIVIGFIVAIWQLFDFITHHDKEKFNSFDYIKFTVFGVVFFVIDIVFWPVYLLGQFLEWFWNIRKHR